MKVNGASILVTTFVSILAVIIFSCEDDEIAKDNIRSSFDQIQDKVFNVSCAVSGCHSSKDDATYAQHKLVLTAGSSWGSLVNAAPQNEKAAEGGLKRVKPGDLEKSLLVHKLRCPGLHHTSDYGSQMPLGKASLSQGQIDFIKQWISQGAAENEIIDADTSLLDDNVPSCPENFEPLASPAAGDGFQLKVESFEVRPQFEREIFVYKELSNQTETFINRIEMKMRRNSHHFLVNTFDAATPPSVIPPVNVVRDLRNEDGTYSFQTLSQMQYHVFAIATQTQEFIYNFPPGVALRIPANHRLDMNLHYVNKSEASIQGECYMNLYTVQPGSVQHEAKPIFLNNMDIQLPANQRTTVTKTFVVNAAMNIFMLTSHTHKLAEKFEIQISGGPRNGQVIYTSTVWHHPLVKTFETPIQLNPGEIIVMRVTYNNTTNVARKFGLTSEDEMGIIYGYYY